MQKWPTRTLYLCLIPLWIFTMWQKLHSLYFQLGIVSASLFVLDIYNHLLLRVKEKKDLQHAFEVLVNRIFPMYIVGSTIFIIFINKNGELNNWDNAAIIFSMIFLILFMIYRQITWKSFFSINLKPLMLNETIWNLTYEYISWSFLFLASTSIFIVTGAVGLLIMLFTALFLGFITIFVVNSYYRTINQK